MCPDEGRLFPIADYREHLKRAALDAGIDAERARAMSPHDLRHSRITHAVSSPGASTAGVAYLAGHRLVSTTDLYAHPQLAAAEAALRAVEGGTGSGQGARRPRRAKR
ncbi:MAG: site-specific integrase [Polyangiaceae bacterium]|nr:site-specific integrase [Polyangiaceae bacterium]